MFNGLAFIPGRVLHPFFSNPISWTGQIEKTIELQMMWGEDLCLQTLDVRKMGDFHGKRKNRSNIMNEDLTCRKVFTLHLKYTLLYLQEKKNSDISNYNHFYSFGDDLRTC